MRPLLISVVLVMLVFAPLTQAFSLEAATAAADAACAAGSVAIVESMPVGVNIPLHNETIFDAWLQLITNATSTIDIAGMYMTLTQGSEYPPEALGWKGQAIYDAIINATKRGVRVRFVQTWPQQDPEWAHDPQALAAAGVDVRDVLWPKLTNGSGGVLHTKFMVVDGASLYLGSANWDWRSLVQIKELGIVVRGCRAMATDLLKIFELYWLLAGKNSLPANYPPKLDTPWNLTNYSLLDIGGADFEWFFAASPKGFITPSRTDDWEALVNVINRAEVKICVSVMDYSPVTLYQPRPEYWGAIDNALRQAAIRGVTVQLLFARWAHTSNVTLQFMRSLAALDNVQVKLMEIPPGPGPVIPFTRVNHSKYMITDNEAYITTSNWTPDYFLHTGGVSISFRNAQFQADVQTIFDRDWNSQYSTLLEP